MFLFTPYTLHLERYLEFSEHSIKKLPIQLLNNFDTISGKVHLFPLEGRTKKINLGFPGGSDGKASVFNAGDPGSSPGLRRRNSRIPPQLEKNHVVPSSSQHEALARHSVSKEVPRSY